MTPSPDAEALLAEPPRRGFPAAEIFEKQRPQPRFAREGAAQLWPRAPRSCRPPGCE